MVHFEVRDRKDGKCSCPTLPKRNNARDNLVEKNGRQIEIQLLKHSVADSPLHDAPSFSPQNLQQFEPMEHDQLVTLHTTHTFT